METRPFGATGLSVPVIGMGTWRTFDVRGAANEERCRRVIDVAYEKGALFFDSSPMYGRAERVLAHALEGRREEAIVATKVWASTGREGREQIEQALEWFGGRVDVYQVHNLMAWRDHLIYLRDLKAAGKVRVVGVTHYNHDAFPELLKAMESGLVSAIQVPYNAADREVEKEILPAAQEHGLGVIVMRPLGEGWLPRGDPGQEALGPLWRFGVRTWAQALLKWILADTRVHVAIPATRSPAHMADNADAATPPWLDADAREYVSQLARQVSRA